MNKIHYLTLPLHSGQYSENSQGGNDFSAWPCTRGMFCPFHAFVSRALCSNAQCHVNKNLILTSPRIISEVASSNFFNHDIFHLDTRTVKRFRGCVADFILFNIYTDCIFWFTCPKLPLLGHTHTSCWFLCLIKKIPTIKNDHKTRYLWV